MTVIVLMDSGEDLVRNRYSSIFAQCSIGGTRPNIGRAAYCSDRLYMGNIATAVSASLFPQH